MVVHHLGLEMALEYPVGSVATVTEAKNPYEKMKIYDKQYIVLKDIWNYLWKWRNQNKLGNGIEISG